MVGLLSRLKDNNITVRIETAPGRTTATELTTATQSRRLYRDGIRTWVV